MGARSFTELRGVEISADSANSVSLARQAGPLVSISFMLRGGFGPGQIDGMSIKTSPDRMPTDMESFLEYVISFICLPLILPRSPATVMLAKNNLNWERKKFLM